MATRPEMEYFARAGSKFSNKQAQIIGPILMKMAEADKLTVPNLIEAARPEDSPLHPLFTWEEPIGAQLNQEHEARQIIGTMVDSKGVRIFHAIKGGPMKQPDQQAVTAYRIIKSDPNGQPHANGQHAAFRTFLQIKRSPEDSDELMTDVTTRLIGAQKRYNEYANKLALPVVALLTDKADQIIPDAVVQQSPDALVQMFTAADTGLRDWERKVSPYRKLSPLFDERYGPVFKFIEALNSNNNNDDDDNDDHS